MKNKKDNTTKYGEQVCSEFEWLPPEIQKERAKRLVNMTKNKEKNKEN